MIPSHKRSDQPQAIGEAFLQEGSLISILGQIEDRQKIQASLYEALEILELGHFAPEISLEAIELLGMDAKQVIRDLDSWEEEFDGLGQEFSDLKRQAKT